jgi:hypothetical protein
MKMLLQVCIGISSGTPRNPACQPLRMRFGNQCEIIATILRIQMNVAQATSNS